MLVCIMHSLPAAATVSPSHAHFIYRSLVWAPACHLRCAASVHDLDLASPTKLREQAARDRLSLWSPKLLSEAVRGFKY